MRSQRPGWLIQKSTIDGPQSTIDGPQSTVHSQLFGWNAKRLKKLLVKPVPVVALVADAEETAVVAVTAAAGTVATALDILTGY